jgi:hypothetical protein
MNKIFLLAAWLAVRQTESPINSLTLTETWPLRQHFHCSLFTILSVGFCVGWFGDGPLSTVVGLVVR